MVECWNNLQSVVTWDWDGIGLSGLHRRLLVQETSSVHGLLADWAPLNPISGYNWLSKYRSGSVWHNNSLLTLIRLVESQKMTKYDTNSCSLLMPYASPEKINKPIRFPNAVTQAPVEMWHLATERRAWGRVETTSHPTGPITWVMSHESCQIYKVNYKISTV